MAKIEKPSALNHIEEITRTADGIMIARGDLGIELPIFDVPGWQKKIIREARDQGKPVVVSTQMLESMVSSTTPTRAEVSDVAKKDSSNTPKYDSVLDHKFGGQSLRSIIHRSRQHRSRQR